MREERGDLTLAERTVERVIDVRDCHTQPTRRIAINLHESLQPAILKVAGDIREFRQPLQRADQPRRPLLQQLLIRTGERELKLSATDPVLDRQLLDRLQVECDPLHCPGAFPQPANDRRGRVAPFAMGLEIDEHAPAVERRVGPVDSDEGRKAFDRRILENSRRERLLAGRHRRERH